MADMGDNELQVIGEASLLRRFQEQADERFAPLPERDPFNGQFTPSVLSFHRLLPTPVEVVARGYAPSGGGYDWQKDNWGVKWGAVDANLLEGPDGLCYYFETAWVPPLPFLQAVSELNPALTFLLSFTPPISRLQENYAFQAGKSIDVDDLV